MSRRAAGPRLYLRQNRRDRRTGKPLPDVWVIRDGTVEISTGCPPDGPVVPVGAEGALADYLAKKWEAGPPEPKDRKRDPAQVLVTEVLAAYAVERAPGLLTDGATTAGFIKHLAEWWGRDDKTLADVRRSTCQAYIAHRITQPNSNYKDPETAPRVSARTASRELDDLGGAIAWWDGEHPLTTVPAVWRPEAEESPRDALTRAQAAALLWAALGWRKGADGDWSRLGPSQRANRAHLRRFILMALYTGTRHTVMLKLLWTESPLQAWVDLDAGMIYRRGRAERDRANKKRPVVKLPRRLLAHMRRWARLDAAARERARDPLVANTVLHHGGHALAGRIRTGFEGCVQDAGLPAEITPHWMRHTAATWLMEADATPWDAAGYLGMTVATLEEHYGHLRPSYQASTAGKAARGGR